jgi:hypothetical protein
MGIAQRLLDSIKAKCATWGCSDILEQLLDAHDVRLCNQYGGTLTGDAAIRFFSIIKPNEGQQITIDQLTLPDNEGQWFIQWSTLMHLMSDINRLIQRPTPLCDHEIDKLCNLIGALAHQWNITYAGHVFPKLHVLCIGLPRFVKQHKTVSHTLLSLLC